MIIYTKGDATLPEFPPGGRAIIAHVCNDRGAWGAGFSGALSSRYPEAERAYRAGMPWTLGKTQGPVWVQGGSIAIVNMIAQHGLRSYANPAPLNYHALETCLRGVAQVAHAANASVHMPRIGCGLAGGVWSSVEEIIQRVRCRTPVVVYDIDR